MQPKQSSLWFTLASSTALAMGIFVVYLKVLPTFLVVCFSGRAVMILEKGRSLVERRVEGTHHERIGGSFGSVRGIVGVPWSLFKVSHVGVQLLRNINWWFFVQRESTSKGSSRNLVFANKELANAITLAKM